MRVRGDFQFDTAPPDSEASDDKPNLAEQESEKVAPAEQKMTWLKRLKGGVIPAAVTETSTSSDTDLEPVKPPFSLRGIDIRIARGEIRQFIPSLLLLSY